MNEQFQYLWPDKSILSKDEITVTLDAPLSNEERLREEKVQDSILHLIRTDQGWWRDSGKTALKSIRQLVESNPKTELAKTISSLMLKVAVKLHEAIQHDDTVSNLIWAEVLAVGLPASCKVKVWIDVLNRLSQVEYNSAYERWWKEQGKDVISNLCLLADKNPQSPLATALASFAQEAAMKVQTAVQGNDLDVLPLLLDVLTISVSLSHGTKVWTDLIEKLLDIPAENVINIVSDYPEAFEEVLQQLIKMPTSQKAAMHFFAMLAENGYPKKLLLLEHMLLVIANEQANMEMLLKSACLDDAREVVYFLELHCQKILSEHPLPPTLLEYIQQYLNGFDPNYLHTNPTQELLQRLQKRNEKPGLRLPTDLQAYVQGWYSIAEFINRPTISKFWLRNVSAMPPLTPDQQIQLTATLVPHLVKLVSTEADLCRVLDNLAPVLIGSGTGSIDPGLLLLAHMISPVVEMYKQERLLLKLIPYIKVMLEEAHHVSSPEKEEYICRCLPGLLGCVNVETFIMLNAYAAQWPPTIQFEEWTAYLTDKGLLPRVEVAAPTKRINTVSPLPAEEKLQRIVAMVNSQYIYFEQFRKLYSIKALYLQYDADVKQPVADQDSMHSRKKEWQTLMDTKQLQQAALDDLVDNVLIQEAIAELVKQDSRLSLNLDPGRQLHPTFQHFKTFWESIYATWLRNCQLDDEDVRFALRLFIRRDLFDWHLQSQKKSPKSLNDWLKKYKPKAKIALFDQDIQ